MPNAGYATLGIIPSLKGVEGRLKSELDGPSAAAGTQAGKSLSKSLLTAATAAGVGVAIGSFLKGAFAEAGDAQKVGAQTEAVLKSTGEAARVSADDVGTLAESLSKKAAIDDEVIQSGENVLLTFTKIRNEQGKGNDIFNRATAVALDMSVALGTDLKGSAIQVGKALNDPIKGVSALQRVGVSFTESQKEQIKTLVETGDTLGAQKLILKELNTEFAGSAAGQATSADKAKVAIGNFKESVGTLLLPVLEEGADLLTTFADGFTKLPEPLQQIAVVGVLAGGGLAVVAKGIGALKDTTGILKDVGGSVSKLIGKAGAAGGGEGLLAIGGAAAAWAGAAFLIGGTAVGLSRTISGETAKINLDLARFSQQTDTQLAKALGAIARIDPEIAKGSFKKLLETDPGQAPRFIAALDAAGVKTGWYKDQLDKKTEGEARAKVGSEKHAAAVDAEAVSLDGGAAAAINFANTLLTLAGGSLGAEQAHRSATEAQLAMNDAIAKFGPFSKEAKDASLAYEQASIAAAAADATQEQQQKDLAVALHDGSASYDDLKKKLYEQLQLHPENAYAIGLEVLQLEAARDRANELDGKKPKITIVVDSAQAIADFQALLRLFGDDTNAEAAGFVGGVFGIPKASSGGVFSMPKSGGLAVLHGDEAVLPLDDPSRSWDLIGQSGLLDGAMAVGGGAADAPLFGSLVVQAPTDDPIRLAYDTARLVDTRRHLAGV